MDALRWSNGAIFRDVLGKVVKAALPGGRKSYGYGRNANFTTGLAIVA